MLRNLEVPHKSSEIFSVILPIFKVSMNLAHIKCLTMLLGALCAVQTVCLSKLAGAFDSKASRESSFRRIQRFMSQMVLDLDAVAGYLKSRLPSDGPYTLTMDRTLEVRRGEYQCVSSGHSLRSYVVPHPVQTAVQAGKLQLQGTNQYHAAVHPPVRP